MDNFSGEIDDLDTNNELIEAFDESMLMFYMMMIMTTSSYKFVNLNELEECVNPSLDTNVWSTGYLL